MTDNPIVQGGQQQDSEFDVEAGPLKVRTKNYRISDLATIAAVILLGFVAFVANDFRTDFKMQANIIATASKNEHESLSKAVEKQTDVQNEMNYILTLSPEDRTRLRIAMPESLRRKVIER